MSKARPSQEAADKLAGSLRGVGLYLEHVVAVKLPSEAEAIENQLANVADALAAHERSKRLSGREAIEALGAARGKS